MRKTTYILLFLVLGLTITSCKKYLDVAPENATDSPAVFETQEGVLFALNGLYAQVQRQGYYGMQLAVLGDAATDNGKIPSDRENAGANADRMPYAYTLALNPQVTALEMWRDVYILINNINNIINNIDKATDLLPGVRKQVLGECLALRALAHFDLVKVFAQDYNFTAGHDHPGVPYITGSIPSDKPVRNTVKEVFDKAYADVNEAVALLENNNSINRRISDRRYFINYYSAVGVRAKMNFYTTNYPAALADANIIVAGPYSLPAYSLATYSITGLNFSPALITAWAGREILSTEAIFMLDVSDNDGVFADRSLIDIYTAYGGNAAHAISLGFLGLYDNNDIRRNWYKVEINDPLVFKYPGGFGLAEDDHNFPIMRLSEFILMKAECEVRVNTAEPAARTLVNQIIRRAHQGSTAYDITSSGPALIEAIIGERRKEMAFESNRLFDLKRLQRGFTRTDCRLSTVCTVAYPDKIYAWPIPQSEFNGNPNMVQNPGY